MGKKMRISVCLAALALIAGGARAQEPAYRDSNFRIADIRARLLLEETGVLSPDISDNPDFIAWNSIIGEGSAGENANDLLVTAILAGPGEHNLRTPLVLTVRNARGRVLATRSFPSMLAGRRTYRSILVHDAGCEGALTLTARLGSSVRTERVSLDCGE
jgi:hypothetical protein